MKGRPPFRLIVAAVLGLICLGAVVAFFMSGGAPSASGGTLPFVSMDRRWPSAVALIALLAVFLVTAMGPGRRLGRNLRDLLTWVAIGLFLVVLYGFRSELGFVAQRTLAVLVPGMAVTDPISGKVSIARGAGGHFVADGSVDGTPVTFVVDTGASAIVLTARDAAAAGLDVDRLRYDEPVMTANGEARAASVVLDTVSIGGITEKAVPALVARAGAVETSLLGLTFLNRLGGYAVSGDELTLTPR